VNNCKLITLLQLIILSDMLYRIIIILLHAIENELDPCSMNYIFVNVSVLQNIKIKIILSSVSNIKFR